MKCLVTLLAILSGGTGAALAQVTAPTDSTAPAILQALQDDGPAKALDVLGDLHAQAAADPFLIQQSPAIAAIHRSLSQLSRDEQYEMLRSWTLPQTGTEVRVLTALVPEIAPPMEFARAIGERPKKESFAVASVGEVGGFFCSAWMLVVAADESGNLRKLITDLEPQAAKQTPNAAFVLTLAKLRDSRSSVDELKGLLESRTAATATEMSSRREDAVILAAAIQRAELAKVWEPLAEKLVQYDFTTGGGPWMSFLRRLRATAILKSHSPESDVASILKATPPFWIAAADQRRNGLATGSDQALWLTHENHVQRLSGPGDDLLLFRYPLTGKFELKGEVSVFDHGVAGMTFGGMSFDANDKLFTVHDVMRPFEESRTWPFVAAKELRLFNRLNVRSDGQRVLYLSNLHPGASTPLSSCESSPWLGLQASGYGRAYFRNLEIVGEPTIPREVTLVKGADLRGWTTPLGETLPRAVQPLLTPATETVAAAVTPTDWSVTADGVLENTKAVATDAAATNPRQLAWMRPLLDGETLSYEFFYEDQMAEVHPTLGRLAFLLEPGGVRIRWITTGQTEWTGLEPDNAVIEPLNRKGPRSLPFQAQDWNAVTLQMQDGKLQIALNGETIYVRPVADLSNLHPGFFHQPQLTTARIRNVKLNGGDSWPETLTVEQMSNPVAITAAPRK